MPPNNTNITESKDNNLKSPPFRGGAGGAGPLWKQIVMLGLPIVVGQVGMVLTGFADTLMVGRYTTEALAAASFVNNLFNLAFLACIGFSYGMTPLIGALFSQHRSHESGAMVRAGLIANFGFGVLVTAIMFAVYLNLHRLGQPEELLPLIRPFFLIYLACIIPTAIFGALSQWSYGINRTKLPMWITLSCNVLNVVFNWFLIYGSCGFPELGLNGAGIATLMSRLGCMGAMLAVFCFRPEFRSYRLGFAAARRRGGRLRRVVTISCPIALQLSLETCAFSGCAVLVGWLGTIDLAAYQVILVISTLGFCVFYAMASAMSVLVANAAGLGDVRLMRALAFSGYKVVLITMVLSSLTLWLLARPLVCAFTEDPLVIALAVTLIPPLLLYQLGDATQITFANALRGTSRVKIMSWIAFVCYICLGLPSSYLFAFTFGWGTRGVVLSFSVSLFSAAILFLSAFLRYTRHQNA